VDLLRIAKFAGVSGAGVCLDYVIYTLLCSVGLDAGLANLVSAGCGVTFVFVASARQIFAGGDGFLLRLFVLYAAYQVLAITVASAAVHETTALFDGRYLLGKTVVLPFTFAANYLFMSWLFGARGRLRPA
jgi:putative flippase GtrA